MSKTIEEILAPKPEARPRIYAYSINDQAHAGLLKVGQTTRNVKQRVAEQLKTANIKNYRIELDETAERDDGTTFTDHEVRAALVKKKFENTELEWMRCTVADLRTVLIEIRAGKQIAGTRGLDQISVRSGCQRAKKIVGVLIDGQHDDLKLRQPFRELPHTFDAIHTRKVDIHHRDLRL